ncbi:MAG: 3-dehydroquinate dehydratase [Desulfovibrionaceae bacterium]|nr:3-dehydroquinate dehydratase [Desulfovibrionaceae bacterium]
MKIALIHGPNFTYLHKREPVLYGAVSLPEIEQYVYATAKRCGISLECHSSHSNIEGKIIDYLEEAYKEKFHGVILNAGAYTHTSLAIADCLAWLPLPVVEVHLSQVFARESIRHTSTISAKCIATIIGCGIMGYGFALEVLAKHCGTIYEG